MMEQLYPVSAAMAVITMGVSPTAQAVDNALLSDAPQPPSISLSKRSDYLMVELHDLWNECQEENWDGYGAKGINPSACDRAMGLVKTFDDSLPIPELFAMPDGDVAFEWYFGPRRSITVLVGDNHRLVWAALNGDEDSRGTISFTSSFPESIRNKIEELAA